MYRCTITGCDEVFTRPSSLKSHLASLKHASVRPYSCAKCGQGFTRKNDHQRHIESNQNCSPYGALVVKKWCCPRCGKAFSRNSALHLHQRQTRCIRIPGLERDERQTVMSTISHNPHISNFTNTNATGQQLTEGTTSCATSSIRLLQGRSDEIQHPPFSRSGSPINRQLRDGLISEFANSKPEYDYIGSVLNKFMGINDQNDLGCTLLHNTVKRYTSHTSALIPMLLQHGADPCIKNDWGLNAFQVAALSSSEAFDVLVYHSSRWKERLEYNDTLVHWAARLGLRGLAFKLLDVDNSLANSVNDMGWTPLHSALCMKRYNLEDSIGKIRRNGVEDILAMIRIILVHGRATINNKLVWGDTALHLACRPFLPIPCMSDEYCEGRRLEIVRLLLEHGADCFTADRWRHTPLDVISSAEQTIAERKETCMRTRGLILIHKPFQLEVLQRMSEEASQVRELLIAQRRKQLGLAENDVLEPNLEDARLSTTTIETPEALLGPVDTEREA